MTTHTLITCQDDAVVILGDDDAGDQSKPHVVQIDGRWMIEYGKDVHPITDQVFDLLVTNHYLKSKSKSVFVPTAKCGYDALELSRPKTPSM